MCQFVWLIYYISKTVDHYEYIFDFSNAPKRSGYSFHDKIFAQWTFWYCNDIGVTSPPILLWHCWSIVNETHDDVNLQYQPDIKILRLDQSNFKVVMTSLRSGRNPPGSYTSSASATIVTRLYYGNWKIKASGDFFSVSATKNMCFSFFFSEQRHST